MRYRIRKPEQPSAAPQQRRSRAVPRPGPFAEVVWPPTRLDASFSSSPRFLRAPAGWTGLFS